MDFLKRVLGDKKEWKRMEARAEALPSDYRIVYGEIKKYMWRFTAGDGMDIVAILKDLLELFETGAADGKRALEITGEDVAAFCDELLRNANTYAEKWHEALNRDVMNKLQSDPNPWVVR
jgi:DNA-binding ferritin-like protein (Dps family)